MFGGGGKLPPDPPPPMDETLHMYEWKLTLLDLQVTI